MSAIHHEPHAILQLITEVGYQSIMLRLEYDDYRRGELVYHIVVVKLIGDAWKLINPGSFEIDILNEPMQVTELLDYCVGSDVYAFTV